MKMKLCHIKSHVKEITVVLISSIIFLYPFICGFIGAPASLVFRPTYLSFLMALGILVLPSKIFKRNSIYEILLNVIVILGIIGNTWVSYNWIQLKMTFDLTNYQIALTLPIILGAMEITRRTSVGVMNYIAIPSILYAFLGPYLPGLFGHGGMSLDRLLLTQLSTTDGIYGTPLAIGATYIGLFVFFAAFLEASGAHEKFMNFTKAIAGNFTGGSAKMAIAASSLMGMISGSSVTNIVSTGIITIPLMKKSGFKKEYAAGVEATASLGSQMTPPILGATAFLIAEFTRTSFFTIILISIAPCILYYLGVFTQVHLYAHKHKIGGLPRSELPNLKKSTIEIIPYIFPIIVLVLLLYKRYSPEYAISYGIIAFVIIILFGQKTRINFIKNLPLALKNGAKNCLPLVASLAIAGLIIGILTMTGLGDRLSYIITKLAGDSFALLVIFTAVVCMILGMGLVTIGAYVLVAIMAAPVIIDSGVPILAAHFFIFYFAVVSAISPPVMVGVFAASSIADSSPMKSAVKAIRLAIVGFIIPFLFVYNPDILLIEGITIRGLFYIFTAACGIISLSISFERYSIFNNISIWKSIIYFIIAIMCMIPHAYLSIIGFILLVFILTLEYISNRKLKTNTISSEETN